MRRGRALRWGKNGVFLWLLAVLMPEVGLRAQSAWGWSEAASAFQGGEKLEYKISYGIARGAEARFEVRDTVIGGEAVHHFWVEGRTCGLLDMLYPVHDVYRSYALKRNGLPISAIRDVHEQKYVDYKEDLYDRESRGDSLVLTREDGSRHVLPWETMDLVSVFFYIRNRIGSKQPTAGEEISMPVFFNGEFYPMKVQYKGTEVVKTEFGKLRCYRFVPLVKVGDLFKTQDAVSVWLTADANHIPVRVRFKLFLGALYCDMTGFSGLRWPLEVEM